jgi:hypothetical protein
LECRTENISFISVLKKPEPKFITVPSVRLVRFRFSVISVRFLGSGSFCPGLPETQTPQRTPTQRYLLSIMYTRPKLRDATGSGIPRTPRALCPRWMRRRRRHGHRADRARDRVRPGWSGRRVASTTPAAAARGTCGRATWWAPSHTYRRTCPSPRALSSRRHTPPFARPARRLLLLPF